MYKPLFVNAVVISETENVYGMEETRNVQCENKSVIEVNDKYTCMSHLSAILKGPASGKQLVLL